MLSLAAIVRSRDVLVHAGFWLVQDYLREIYELDRRQFPTLREIERAIGPIEAEALPVPADCTDGFLGAYWRRPAEYLDPRARAAISTFSRFDTAAAIARLAAELVDGTWSARHRELLNRSELDVGYRLVVARSE